LQPGPADQTGLIVVHCDPADISTLQTGGHFEPAETMAIIVFVAFENGICRGIKQRVQMC
jgi:hypothetical protein